MIRAEVLFCPGCHHGMTRKILFEVMDEMDIHGQCISVTGVGCYGGLGTLLGTDNTMYAHGPSPAVATGIKRVVGDEAIVFTLQ